MPGNNDRRILRTIVDPFAGRLARTYVVETFYNARTEEWQTTVTPQTGPDNQERGRARVMANATCYGDRPNQLGAASNHKRVVEKLHRMWREIGAQQKPD